MKILCQFCLDRQIPEPEEGIYEYQHRPICDLCLGMIMENAENTQVVHEVEEDPRDLPARLKRSIAALVKSQKILDDNWCLHENEVLHNRDDFFNLKPPAIINLTNDQVKQSISFKKAQLFAIRIMDEHNTMIIDKIRIEERREAGLQGVTKSIKERVKKNKIVQENQNKHLAALGITQAMLEALGAQARAEEFKGVKPELSKWERTPSETRESLTQLQAQIKAQTTHQPEVSFTAKTVVRCQVCKKLTCICPR